MILLLGGTAFYKNFLEILVGRMDRWKDVELPMNPSQKHFDFI